MRRAHLAAQRHGKARRPAHRDPGSGRRLQTLSVRRPARTKRRGPGQPACVRPCSSAAEVAGHICTSREASASPCRQRQSPEPIRCLQLDHCWSSRNLLEPTRHDNGERVSRERLVPNGPPPRRGRCEYLAGAPSPYDAAASSLAESLEVIETLRGLAASRTGIVTMSTPAL